MLSIFRSQRWLFLYKFSVIVLFICALWHVSTTWIRVTQPFNILHRDIIQDIAVARAIKSFSNPYSMTVTDLSLKFIGDADPTLIPHVTPRRPFVPILLIPFCELSLHQLSLAWFLVSTVLFIVCSGLLLKEFELTVTPWTFLAIISLGLFSNSLTTDLIYGGYTTFILLLLVIYSCGRRRGITTLCGFSLGLSLAIKYFFWPIALLLLTKREFRILGTAALTFTIVNLIELAATGLDAQITYFSEVTFNTASFWRLCEGNYSLTTIGAKFFEGVRFVKDAYLPPPMDIGQPTLALLISTTLVISFVGFSILKATRITDHLASELSLVPISLLACPVTWDHYFVALLPLILINVKALSFKWKWGGCIAITILTLLTIIDPDLLHFSVYKSGEFYIGPSALICLLPAFALLGASFLIQDPTRPSNTNHHPRNHVAHKASVC